MGTGQMPRLGVTSADLWGNRLRRVPLHHKLRGQPWEKIPTDTQTRACLSRLITSNCCTLCRDPLPPLGSSHIPSPKPKTIVPSREFIDHLPLSSIPAIWPYTCLCLWHAACSPVHAAREKYVYTSHESCNGNMSLGCSI